MLHVFFILKLKYFYFLFLFCLFVCSNSRATEKVLNRVQEFITSLSNFTEGESQRLSEEVSTNQAQSNYQGRFTHILKLLQNTTRSLQQIVQKCSVRFKI